jgi:hypothetical protein
MNQEMHHRSSVDRPSREISTEVDKSNLKAEASTEVRQLYDALKEKSSELNQLLNKLTNIVNL